MAQDIAALLKKYAEFYELLRVTESLPDPDPAVSMLRQGFAELYDALDTLKVTWIPVEEQMPITEGGNMTTKAHKKLDELEKVLLDIWAERVDGMKLAALRDYFGSSRLYHRLRETRDQLDACLGNLDEIRMALYKPPFGIEAEEDEGD